MPYRPYSRIVERAANRHSRNGPRNGGRLEGSHRPPTPTGGSPIHGRSLPCSDAVQGLWVRTEQLVAQGRPSCNESCNGRAGKSQQAPESLSSRAGRVEITPVAGGSDQQSRREL
jgi:hypothetical protein